MATRGKPSVFAALSQLRVSEDFDSDNDSAEERQQERKEKLKQKKKSRNKKKNSDSAQLKDLAFVSVSKPKKSKGKKKAAPGSPVEEVQPSANGASEEKTPEVSVPKPSLADMIKAAPQPQSQKTAAVPNVVAKKPQPAAPQQQQQQQQQKTASPPKQHQQSQQQPQHRQNQQAQNVAPPPAPAAPVAPAAASAPPSSSETELGAVYTPAHITITRVDGQMKRTVAVTEVMDQLLRYTQQNTQLLMVQDQLGHANRSLQDQLQRSAEIINGLQNEVTMFRQMCLNLQAEVSLLRSSGPAPDVGGSNPEPQHHHRPPPGMS